MTRRKLYEKGDPLGSPHSLEKYFVIKALVPRVEKPIGNLLALAESRYLQLQNTQFLCTRHSRPEPEEMQ